MSDQETVPTPVKSAQLQQDSLLDHPPVYSLEGQSLIEINEALIHLLTVHQGELSLRFPKPQSPAPYFEGEQYLLNNQPVRFRSLRALIDLAESLHCSFELTTLSDHWCKALLRKKPMTHRLGWHEQSASSGQPEKYGVHTLYGRINKLEEPLIVRDLQLAYEKVRLPPQGRVLSVGCNQGEELFALWTMLTSEQATVRLMGVDHSESAIKTAREKYPLFSFEVEDLTLLDFNRYQKLDLLIAINVLNSPSLDGHQLFKSWVKQLLKPSCSVLVGLPNCRYRGHELTYGAVTRHGGRSPDMAQLFSEAHFYMRYLRQQGFNVWVIGHYHLYIVGRRSVPSQSQQ